WARPTGAWACECTCVDIAHCADARHCSSNCARTRSAKQCVQRATLPQCCVVACALLCYRHSALLCPQVTPTRASSARCLPHQCSMAWDMHGANGDLPLAWLACDL